MKDKGTLFLAKWIVGVVVFAICLWCGSQWAASATGQTQEAVNHYDTVYWIL